MNYVSEKPGRLIDTDPVSFFRYRWRGEVLLDTRTGYNDPTWVAMQGLKLAVFSSFPENLRAPLIRNDLYWRIGL